MENKQWIKLKDLDGKTFIIKSVGDFRWKAWDETTGKMVESDKWQKGYQKRYPVVTDQGEMEVSQAQIKDMLEAYHQNGQSNIIDKSFTVKTNGQTGKEIRYFINAARNVDGEGFNKFLENKEKLKKNIEVPEIDTDNPFPSSEEPRTKEDEDFLRSIPF